MNLPTPKTPISRNNNMDAVRYYLALSVLFAHFAELAQTTRFWPTSSYDAVCGFFAMSGFLVFRSYTHTPNLKHYLGRRARRILPPYIFIILLCAIGFVGVSTLSAADYFGSSKWFNYVAANLSFMNFLEPSLPGVFTNQHLDVVNGSLWTMKVEWMLYFSVPIVYALLRRFHWNSTSTFIVIYVISAAYRLLLNYLYGRTGNAIYYILGHQAFGQLMFFYAGVIIYFHFDQFVRYHWGIFIVAAALLTIGRVWQVPYFRETIEPACISSIVLWFAMIGKWGRWLNRYDNVSYDVYLFHFPVIQLIVWSGLSQYNPWLALAAAVIFTFILATFSWHFVSKRFLLVR